MLPLFDIICRLFFLVVTTVIFVIALLTFSRLRNKKMLFLSIGFGLFFVHGIISIPEIFSNSYNVVFTDSIHLLIDGVALLFLLVGVLQD